MWISFRLITFTHRILYVCCIPICMHVRIFEHSYRWYPRTDTPVVRGEALNRLESGCTCARPRPRSQLVQHHDSRASSIPSRTVFRVCSGVISSKIFLFICSKRSGIVCNSGRSGVAVVRRRILIIAAAPQHDHWPGSLPTRLRTLGMGASGDGAERVGRRHPEALFFTDCQLISLTSSVQRGCSSIPNNVHLHVHVSAAVIVQTHHLISRRKISLALNSVVL